MRNIAFVVFYLLPYSCVWAQEVKDTFASLPALITADRFPHSVSDRVFDAVDSLERPFMATFSIEEMIRQNSPVWIRSNGNNALSTLSIRGSSSQQSIINWNGAQLNSPSLGLTDLSNIPVFLMDKISIQKAGASDLNNPIGGEMLMQNDIPTDEISGGVRIGQFSNQLFYLRARKKGAKWSAGFNTFYHSAEHDFRYLNVHQSALLPEKQPHAQHINYGFIASIERKWKWNSVGIRSWWQNTSRELPPRITQRSSSAIQLDSIRRAQAYWNTRTKTYNQQTQYYYADETNTFRDPSQVIDDQNRFQQHQITSLHHLSINSTVTIKLGGQMMIQNIQSDNINGLVQLNRWAIFPSFHYMSKNGKWWVNGMYRIEQQNDLHEPFAGSLDLGAQLNLQSSIRLNLQRAIRFPSGNDLFWNNFGNPDLLPEQSDQISFSYAFEGELLKDAYSINGTGYYKHVENWILWAPLESIIFRPYNILRVRSMGLEWSLTYQREWTENYATEFRFNYGYQHIRNISDSNSPLALSDGPLIYQPDHLFNFWINQQIGNWSIRYIQDYRSSVYTQPDLSTDFPSLHLGHMRLSYQVFLRSISLQSYITLQNIWNQPYFFQPNLPAPGRQFQLGFHINL